MARNVRTARSGGRSARRRRAAGFTLIEMFVTMVIIGVLITLLLVAISGAVNAARSTADRQSIMGMKVAIGQFESEFGFLPPLINDGPPLDTSGDGGPVNDLDGDGNEDDLVVRSGRFLTGRDDDSGDEDPDIIQDNGADGYSDKRYSKVSLPYYLQGASPVGVDDADAPDGTTRPLDGVEGEGLRTPLRSGGFEPRGRRYGAFYDMGEDRTVVSYFDEREYGEHGESPPDPGDADRNRPAVVAYVDRNGRAFRYYRWINSEPGFDDAGRDDPGEYMNVPRIMLDPFDWSNPEASAASRSAEIAGARYAIIGAGRDGVFGTEPSDALEAAIERRTGGSTSIDARRADAAEDNIVEVGR